MINAALLATCAPDLPATLTMQIIQVESNGNPLSIHINRHNKKVIPIKHKKEAIQIAEQAIKDGHSVDMGLMQVNSKTMQRMGYSVKDLFDPCKNLAIGSAILKDNYLRAKEHYEEPQQALRAALSAYNTGNFYDGMTNGYVEKYYPKVKLTEFTIRIPYTTETTIFKRSVNNEHK